MKKVIHYINQFFAGIGGEEKADVKPEIHEGVVGPGAALQSMIDADIAYTVICGDNFMASNRDEAVEEVINMIKDKDFDLFIAGPAFQAGRYGVSCGEICKAVKEKLNKPVLTSMNLENPGVDMFKSEMLIVKGGKSAAKMKDDCKMIANIANKILSGESPASAEEDNYFATGRREQVFLDEPVIAAKRGVDMLIKKLNGEDYQTELVIEKKKLVPIAEPIKDLSKAKIALVTTGGIVPVDNPDKIQSASATRWGRYDISGMDRLKMGEFKTIHAGFDPAAANQDPNRIMPIDVIKEMEKEGVFGSLHPYFYSTVGTGTTQKEAARMGQEMVELLKEDNVDGVILVST